MNILITGGAGFVGSNLARALHSRGHSVMILDDFSTGLETNLAGMGLNITIGTIADASLLCSLVTNQDTVVHLAARGSVPRSIADPRATHEINMSGTLNVLEAARQAGAHVIFSSSSSVFGSNLTSPKTERLRLEPVTPYAASKAAAESYMRAYSSSYGLDVLTFRFFNIFGPWQRPDHDYAAVIPRWVWAALNGQRLIVNGDGSVSRDFTFIDDVVELLVVAIENRQTHLDPINLAFGRPITLSDILFRIERKLGPQEIIFGPPRPGDILNSENDPSLLFSLFPGFRPIEFDQGLQLTIDWMLQRSWSSGSHSS